MVRVNSIEAYKALKANKRMTAMRWGVYSWLWEHGPKTSGEISLGIGQNEGRVRPWQPPQCTWLLEHGLIKEGLDRACTTSGSMAAELDVTAATSPYTNEMAALLAKLTRAKKRHAAAAAIIENIEAKLVKKGWTPSPQPTLFPVATTVAPAHVPFVAQPIVTGPAPQQSSDEDPKADWDKGPVPLGLVIETYGGRTWVCAGRGECARHQGRQLLDAGGVCVHCRTAEHKPSGT